jgi:hypothetical protein
MNNGDVKRTTRAASDFFAELEIVFRDLKQIAAWIWICLLSPRRRTTSFGDQSLSISRSLFRGLIKREEVIDLYLGFC